MRQGGKNARPRLMFQTEPRSFESIDLHGGTRLYFKYHFMYFIHKSDNIAYEFKSRQGMVKVFHLATGEKSRHCRRHSVKQKLLREIDFKPIKLT